MIDVTKTAPSFTLTEYIQGNDYVVMAKLWEDSFLTDTHTNLQKYQSPGEQILPGESLIRDWVASNESHVLKAISTATGDIAGWVCWGHRGYIYRESKPESTSGEEVDARAKEEELTPVQRLGRLTGSHFREFMTDIMPQGTKCWYISTLVVGPQFQGKGLGRAMIDGARRGRRKMAFLLGCTRPTWPGRLIRLVGLRLLECWS